MVIPAMMNIPASYFQKSNNFFWGILIEFLMQKILALIKKMLQFKNLIHVVIQTLRKLVKGSFKTYLILSTVAILRVICKKIIFNNDDSFSRGYLYMFSVIKPHH